MDKQIIQAGIQELHQRGYSALDAGDQIIVQDPRHKCGTGPDGGCLTVDGYADCALRSGNAVTKFLYDRS